MLLVRKGVVKPNRRLRSENIDSGTSNIGVAISWCTLAGLMSTVEAGAAVVEGRGVNCVSSRKICGCLKANI